MKKFMTMIVLILLFSMLNVTPCMAQSIIYINPHQSVLKVNDTMQVLVSYPGDRINWSSSNTEVAEVEQKGFVTAKAPGDAIISADIYGYKLNCYITVLEESDMFADNYYLISPIMDQVYIGFTNHDISKVKLEFTVSDINILDCKWGKMKNNKKQLLITTHEPGVAAVDVIAEYEDGTREKITIKVMVIENNLIEFYLTPVI